MHLKAHALGIASAVVTAIFYALCVAWYALAPDQLVSFSGYVSHFDFSLVMGPEPTLLSFLAGLVFWFVISYVSGWLFAWFYNRVAK